MNIDAGVWLRSRDKDGKIQPDPVHFPHGIRYLSDELHKKGLKLGIYTDISDKSCGTGPGSQGHYTQDAETFAHDWQVDFLKVDYCGFWNGTNQPPLEHSCAVGAVCLDSAPDIHNGTMSRAAALEWCSRNKECGAFNTNHPNTTACQDSPPALSQRHQHEHDREHQQHQQHQQEPLAEYEYHFKSVGCGRGNPWARPAAGWSSWSKPGAGSVDFTPAPQYAAWKAFGDALNATGRAIYYSICPHTPIPHTGTAAEFAHQIADPPEPAYAPPPQWGKEQRHALANSILVEYVNTMDTWYAPKYKGAECHGWTCHGGVVTDIDSMVQMTNLAFSGPGSWNDADMLQLCTYGGGGTPHTPGGMTLTEYRSHYSVWAVLASPLILSADLRSVKQLHPECLALMLNREIIAVNQDKASATANDARPHHPPFLIRLCLNTTKLESIMLEDTDGWGRRWEGGVAASHQCSVKLVTTNTVLYFSSSPPLPSLQLCYSTLNIDIMVLLPSFLTHTAGRTPTAASLTSDEQQQQEASQRHYHQRHYVSGVCKAAWYRQQCWRCCGVAEPGRGPCPPRSVLGGAWDCSCAAHGCARCGQQ